MIASTEGKHATVRGAPRPRGRMWSYFPPIVVARRFPPLTVGKFGKLGTFVRNLVFLRTCRTFPVGKLGTFVRNLVFLRTCRTFPVGKLGTFVRNVVFLRTCRTCPGSGMGIYARRQHPE